MSDEMIPRKYQVFISSTFKDLKEHRALAASAVVSARHMATCLETAGLKNELLLDVIKNAVQDCQFYVIILGHCYGSTPADQDKSFIEIELDIAENHFGKDHSQRILTFIMEDGLVETNRINLDRSTTDGKHELENEERYNRFRDRLKTSGRLCRPFRTKEDIDRDLFAFFRESHPGIPGYVLESEDTELIVKITTSNQVVKEIVQRAGRFTVVESRLSKSPDKKQALAKAFAQLHGENIQEGRFDKVFVESGSTLTYLAADLAPFLPKVGLSREAHQAEAQQTEAHQPDAPTVLHKPVVATNNALVYLDLWMCNGVICHPEPDSPPTEDEKYGAMYGPLTGKERAPDYSLPALQIDDPASWKSIEKLKDEVFLHAVDDPRHSICLAAASGLQLSSKVDAIEYLDPDSRDLTTPYTYEPILKLVCECRGFHVGSYENKLLKRSLYLTGTPTIVFIHDDKIDCPIVVGECHFLFDQATPWESIIKEYPLSLWVGCSRDSYEEVLANLKKNMPEEWHFRGYGSGPHPVIVGHNTAFRDAMKSVNVAVYEEWDTKGSQK